ncbi:unnamed protein product [Mesocestoides corti]|uniref:Metallo-beta-lactamase domain-containing protein n=2 Tax=Mesocestoides corti TaxID=53468 RepID=A0A0R3UCY2_MESCO|nr:unnamed protein product [Mesocestoides corti]
MGPGWLINVFEVFGCSISGNETSIEVVKGELVFRFKDGAAPLWWKCAEHRSHGHIDHIGAICQHMHKRKSNDLPPAVNYLLPQLVEPVKELCRIFSQLHGRDLGCFRCPNIVAVDPGSSIQINASWFVESFATDHVVQIQGCILYRQATARGHRIPEVAYTGDTRFSIFTGPAHPDLLRVKLLISEATYLDDSPRLTENAQKYGHVLLRQYAENEHLFRVIELLPLAFLGDTSQVASAFNPFLPEGDPLV